MNTGKWVVFGAGVAGLVVTHLLATSGIDSRGWAHLALLGSVLVMVFWGIFKLPIGRVHLPLNFFDRVALSLYALYAVFWIAWGTLEGKGPEIIGQVFPVVLYVASIPAAILVVVGAFFDRTKKKPDEEPEGEIVIIRSLRVWRETARPSPVETASRLEHDERPRLGRK